jgi:hypothetical protein
MEALHDSITTGSETYQVGHVKTQQNHHRGGVLALIWSEIPWSPPQPPYDFWKEEGRIGCERWKKIRESPRGWMVASPLCEDIGEED